MRKLWILLIAIFFAWNSIAQLHESFSDGDFSNDPVWTGTTGSWLIVANSDVAAGAAGSNTLRLNAPSVGGTEILSTQIGVNWGSTQSWGIWIGRRSQSFTQSNHIYFWLWANESNLSGSTIDGYRIRIGDDGGADEIRLEKVSNGIPQEIFISSGGVPNGLTDIGFLLRVTRTVAGIWEIYTSTLPAATGTGSVATDLPGVAQANILQGSVSDNEYHDFQGGFIGLAVVHSTGAAALSGVEFDQLVFTPGGGVMPVTLEHFSSKQSNEEIILNWRASEERDLHHYEIQRSRDGAAFATIGVIKPLVARKYSFTDIDQITGRLFYRLKMVDIDNSFEYSHLVVVDNKEMSSVEISPNPVREQLLVRFPLINTRRQFVLIDQHGRILLMMESPPWVSSVRIPFGNLSSGQYFLMMRTNDETRQWKIVK